MRTRKATKWLGAVVAALTLSMVTSVSPASAAPSAGGDRTSSARDSGWNSI
jgi:hypothetical protein